jgi:hypothetical protein
MGNSYFMVQISKFSLIFRKTITFEYNFISIEIRKVRCFFFSVHFLHTRRVEPFFKTFQFNYFGKPQQI